MELGFARFLEMFEERFGRVVTTLLMAALAIAAAAWAIQTTVEATVYIYHLVKKADFAAAFKTEHASTHLVILAAQIIVTFLILAVIWRFFWRRQIKALEDDVAASEARITKKLEDAERRSDEFESRNAQREERLNQRTQEIRVRMDTLRATQERLLAERKPPDTKSPLTQPHPAPGQQDKPERA